MSMEAEVIAIGAVSLTDAGFMEYPQEHYRYTSEGVSCTEGIVSHLQGNEHQHGNCFLSRRSGVGLQALTLQLSLQWRGLKHVPRLISTAWPYLLCLCECQSRSCAIEPSNMSNDGRARHRSAPLLRQEYCLLTRRDNTIIVLWPKRVKTHKVVWNRILRTIEGWINREFSKGQNTVCDPQNREEAPPSSPQSDKRHPRCVSFCRSPALANASR